MSIRSQKPPATHVKFFTDTDGGDGRGVRRLTAGPLPSSLSADADSSCRRTARGNFPGQD